MKKERWKRGKRNGGVKMMMSEERDDMEVEELVMREKKDKARARKAESNLV